MVQYMGYKRSSKVWRSTLLDAGCVWVWVWHLLDTLYNYLCVQLCAVDLFQLTEEWISILYLLSFCIKINHKNENEIYKQRQWRWSKKTVYTQAGRFYKTTVCVTCNINAPQRTCSYMQGNVDNHVFTNY